MINYHDSWTISLICKMRWVGYWRYPLGGFSRGIFGIFQAERVDTYLHDLNPEENDRRPYFSTWILYNCLRAMSMYLLSGLELELYSVHEYMYIYWWVSRVHVSSCGHQSLTPPTHRYLSDFLYNWIISTLTRAECLAEQINKTPSSKSKKPKPKKKTMKLYCREIMFSQALKNMFAGYYHVSFVEFLRKESF